MIPSNGPFNAADPRTYPERLTIQVPADFRVLMKQRAWAIFAQDKWRVNQNLTFNLGLRYDLEFTPLDDSANPYFAGDPDDYPVDKNNFSPRVGATYTWDEGRSLLRSGWGLFYDKVNFGMVVDFDRNGINSNSFVAQFPARPHRSRSARRPVPDQSDAGQRSGRQPRAAQPALSAGQASENTGVVWLDRPDRDMPSIQQVSLGYQRQLGTRTSVSADYVHTYGRGLFMQRGPERRRPGHHRRAAPIVRPNPEFVTDVNTRPNVGEYDYDGLNVQLEKREANGWSGRVSYTLSYSRGNTNGEYTAPIQFQFLDDLNLDAQPGPDRSRSAAQPGDQRPRRSAAHLRHDRGRRRCA